MNSIDDKKYQSYLDHRKVLIDIEVKQNRNFDKTAITIASGALALSLGFSGEISGYRPEMNFLIYSGWVSFCISILSTMCSFSFSARDSRRRREAYDLAYVEGRDFSDGENIYTRIVGFLNMLSLCSLVMGVLFLTSFAMVNFEKRGTPMAKDRPAVGNQSQPSADVTKGQPSISAPVAQSPINNGQQSVSAPAAPQQGSNPSPSTTSQAPTPAQEK